MEIIVAARKNDPAGFGVQKYDNVGAWNVPGGQAPNGVSATRYLRKTNPNVNCLCPLARFLVENVPHCVAGLTSSFRFQERVRCFTGETEADVARRLGNYGKNTELAIAVYELSSQLAEIDWLFPIIEPSQTDTDYWNNVASAILAQKINRIVIGDAEWSVI